jgi:hypothetical protein
LSSTSEKEKEAWEKELSATAKPLMKTKLPKWWPLMSGVPFSVLPKLKETVVEHVNRFKRKSHRQDEAIQTLLSYSRNRQGSKT